jgi:murein DD-endopeptidase MepM/ murein hydrolase activator NlpD
MALGLAIPSSADAGVLSSITALFSAKVEYKLESGYNSQTIPLPRAARNIDPHPAIGGGDIVVRNGNALLAESGPEGGVTEFTEGHQTGGQISVYIVREGDTLGEIAQTFGVSINTIKWANDIKRGSTIRVGQKLVILPVTGIKYTIKRGGTLRDVVKKYGGDVDEAAEYNGVGPDEELSKGAVVIIPNGEIATPKPIKRIAKRSVRGVIKVDATGYFVHPLNHAGVRTQRLHGYNAVDIGAPTGTPIIASAAGKVILARGYGYNGGYGIYTIIKHPNGTQTVYAHMSKNISYEGQQVVQGQVIGYVGNTGRSTGPHLHFEVRGARNPF